MCNWMEGREGKGKKRKGGILKGLREEDITKD